MRTAIVIVNYKTPELTINSLRALKPEILGTDDCIVFVVDSASGDGSEATLARAVADEGLDHKVEILALDENKGFAAANNAAIHELNRRKIVVDHVLLLNPDTLPFPGLISGLSRTFEYDSRTGIAGCRMDNLNGSGRSTAFAFHSPARELAKAAGRLSRFFGHGHGKWRVDTISRPCTVDWVSGACMLVKSEVFREIGLLDETYFMYYEEQDFTKRASEMGWRCTYTPAFRLVHLVGQSSGLNMSRREASLPPPYWFRSRQHYFIKCYGTLRTYATNWSVAALLLVRELFRRTAMRSTGQPMTYLRRFFHTSCLPGFTSRKPGGEG